MSPPGAQDSGREQPEAEEHRLRDGTRVRIRPLGPRDERTLQEGFRCLSPESRRRRFRRPKAQLSRAEIRALTEADGRRHVVLGAVRLDEDGWECEGLGLARYACLPHHPEVAEPAVTVLDAAQGLGLGRLLSEALIRAASANGVKTFRALLANEHGWLHDRIRRSYPDARLTRRGAVLGVDFPLPAAPAVRGEGPEAAEAREDGSFWSLLRWVAQGSVRPRQPGAAARLVGKIRRRA